MDSETLESRHRRERKELQAKVQAIKKAVPKGDKRRKKEATEEIACLEADLERRHEAELESCDNGTPAATSVSGSDINNDGVEEDIIDRLQISEDCEEKPQKLSKAQKRRNKKAQEEREKAERIAQAEKDNVNSARNVENKQFAALTAKKNLRIKPIPSDGHCLYNAVIHQLAIQGIQESVESLRRKVADHMRTNVSEFLCFLTKPDKGDALTPDEYEKYCDDVANTAAWGGHHEMKAITELFNKRIEVLQASGPVLSIGDGMSGSAIMLSYHRHEFGLGEHYNSVVARDDKAPADET